MFTAFWPPIFRIALLPGEFCSALEDYFQPAGRRSLWVPLLGDRRCPAVRRHAERAALPDVFLTRPQGVSRISDTVLERQERERPSLPAWRLLAERHQSWEFQHGLQQCCISGLWQICRTSLPPRRHDPRFCGLNPRGSCITGNLSFGVDCWEFLWRENDATGQRVRRTAVIGTVEKYPTRDSAEAAVNGLRMQVNEDRLRQQNNRS